MSSVVAGDSRPGTALRATAARPRLAGDAGVWLFISADVFAFALFFLLFTWGRAHNTALYQQSRQALDAGIGLANTPILLTSSLFMLWAADAAREGSRPRQARPRALGF